MLGNAGVNCRDAFRENIGQWYRLHPRWRCLLVFQWKPFYGRVGREVLCVLTQLLCLCLGERLVDRRRQTRKRGKELPVVLMRPAACEASCQSCVKPSHLQKSTQEAEKVYSVYQLTELIFGDTVESSWGRLLHTSLFYPLWYNNEGKTKWNKCQQKKWRDYR